MRKPMLACVGKSVVLHQNSSALLPYSLVMFLRCEQQSSSQQHRAKQHPASVVAGPPATERYIRYLHAHTCMPTYRQIDTIDRSIDR